MNIDVFENGLTFFTWRHESSVPHKISLSNSSLPSGHLLVYIHFLIALFDPVYRCKMPLNVAALLESGLTEGTGEGTLPRVHSEMVH